MRHAPTASEQLLWRHLRNRQLGVEFRRQVPLLGRYVVDFYASSVRVVVEVDGGYHGDRARADARRDGALEHAGDRVLRLSEELVTRQLEVALARIAAAIRPG
jgi:very-short-patch-repair endonuclease